MSIIPILITFSFFSIFSLPPFHFLHFLSCVVCFIWIITWYQSFIISSPLPLLVNFSVHRRRRPLSWVTDSNQHLPSFNPYSSSHISLFIFRLHFPKKLSKTQNLTFSLYFDFWSIWATIHETTTTNQFVPASITISLNICHRLRAADFRPPCSAAVRRFLATVRRLPPLWVTISNDDAYGTVISGLISGLMPLSLVDLEVLSMSIIAYKVFD